jgi:uncharacterized protein
MRQVGEPSVEEILASIKKVIARDNRMESGQPDAGRAGSARPDPARADVLDLGEIAAQVLSGDRGVGVRERVTAEALGEDGDSPLLGDVTAAAMRDSLAALALLAEPGARPQIVRAGETSLEGLVRDMLRPMLAEWLDKNLPAMVERMVAAEIARIVRKKG